MRVRAILFDTRSIQRYIFSGNKLKTNIGASYIVSNVFQTELVSRILRERYGGDLDESWQQDRKEPMDFSEGLRAACQVAYIGGGNALVLFRDADEEECRQIVYDFTKRLLNLYPGLQTGAAIGELELADEAAYRETRRTLYEQLKRNQRTVFPQVSIPYTGLTHVCDVNGETANAIENDEDGNQRALSAETLTKNQQEKEAQQWLEDLFKDELGEKFTFPRKLEDMGQKPGENYIAAVHIDGNNMGARFARLGLGAYIETSKEVQKKTKEAFKRLLREITEECGDGYGGELKLAQDSSGRVFLPLRPLILGGDDITFVCAAKAALSYATRFMEKMNTENPDGAPIDSCAGIAIQKTSYPFFRLYELAEQACGEAKKMSRGQQGSSWLEFVILHGEQAPTIQEIRKREYRGAWIQNLHFGPYEVGGEAQAERNISRLMDCIRKLQTGEQLPSQNKLKELRYVFQQDEHDIHSFVEQLRYVRQDMPMVEGWERYAQKLWAERDGERKTPFVDAVEMMEFCLPTAE